MRGSPTAKRIFDLAVGIPLAVIFTVPILCLALVAGLSIRAWPFFTQPRIGRGGATFRLVKIRSLPRQAPARASKYALGDVAISRFGQFLRRTHLDELPQLWLVVFGQMSLVGPRPELPELAHDLYPQEFLEARTQTRPGCTGLWQISDASGRLICESPQYDRFYLRHRSLLFDAWILWKTAAATLRGRPVLSLAPGAEDAVQFLESPQDLESASETLAAEASSPVANGRLFGLAALEAATSKGFARSVSN